LDDEKFAGILGVIIAPAASFISFFQGFDINSSILVFLLVFLFGSLSIYLVKKAFNCLKDWIKEKKL
jgi:multisubunit Na+/H+ antiporter MnhG subunit